MENRHDNRLAQLTGTQSTIPSPRIVWWRRALPLLLLLALAGLFLFVARERLAKRIAVQTAAVVVKSISSGVEQPAAVTVQAPGWVEPAPYSVYATALASGIVESVLVLEGDVVEKGQPIAKLVDDDAKLAVARAEAELNSRQAELAAAEANWQHPTALDRSVDVARAQLAESDAALAEIGALVLQKSAERDEAKEVFERFSNTQPGTVPILDVERARYQLQARIAELAATEKKVAVLTAVRTRWQAELAAAEEARRLRIADRRRLDVAKAAVELAEAALAEARLRLERMVVRSPADGVVMELLKAPGSKVMLEMDAPMSSHIVHLYDPKRLQVRVDIPLAEAAGVSVGQEAGVVVDVLPDVTFRGRVVRFVHAANLSKNTIQVKVELSDPSPLLKPDMLARAKFLAPAQAATLHSIAASEGKVWLLTASGDRVEQRTLALGASYETDWRVVHKGLNPGDVVVVQPPPGLVDGQRVSASPAGGH
jgi:HlyD family secretion protein